MSRVAFRLYIHIYTHIYIYREREREREREFSDLSYVQHLRIYQPARIICAIAFVGGGGKNQPMDETILSDTVLFVYGERSNFAITWGNTKLTSQTPLLSKFTRIRRLKALDSNNIEIIREMP